MGLPHQADRGGKSEPTMVLKGSRGELTGTPFHTKHNQTVFLSGTGTITLLSNLRKDPQNHKALTVQAGAASTGSLTCTSYSVPFVGLYTLV